MSRHFKPLDYEATLKTSVRLEECLPDDHLARVDIVAQLDLSALYARYGDRGGTPDLNGDGFEDIVFHNSTTGDISYILLSDLATIGNGYLFHGLNTDFKVVGIH